MTQLNPAWRRRTASSDRLAKIGASFLSDMENSSETADSCRAIPFLLDSPEQEWIVRDLCEVLTQKGHACALLQAAEFSGDSAATLRESLRTRYRDSEYCVLPVNAPATIRAARLDHVVLLVPATLEAVRMAYQRIKYLCERDTPDIGVVLVGPRDQHAAWRYFRKLAVGTLRYLDVPLLNLGFLPEQITPEAGPADPHRDNFMSRIAERLIGSGFSQGFGTDPTGSHE